MAITKYESFYTKLSSVVEKYETRMNIKQTRLHLRTGISKTISN